MYNLEHLKPVRKTVSHRSRLYRIAGLIRCIKAVLLITCFLAAVAAEAQTDTAGQRQKVLVLNSYHRGYDWSDRIVEAIQAEFGKTDLEVELFFEYMDTMRHEFVEASRYMKQLCEAKYSKADLDLIITTDDSALYFLLARRDLLFPGIPVVFCGVQEAENSKPQNYDLVTGVLELYDYQSTAKIALKLHPSAKRIVAITDKNKKGLLREMALDEVLQNLDRKVEVDVLSLGGRSMSGLLEKIEQLGSESILFLVSAFRDKEGVIYTRQESARMIRQRCRAPIYVTGFNWLGLGPVGGRVAYATFQGQEAAKMAIRILNGENPQNIPILQESPNTYMFDYIQLKHFGISPSDLPEDSIIINEPKSFYYQYKKPIWIVTTVIAALAAMVLVLSISVIRRRQAEKALRESQELFNAFMNQLAAVAFIKDENSRIQYVNPYVVEEFDADRWTNHTAMDYFPREIAEGVLAHDKKVLAEGPSAKEEWVPDKNGNMRCMHAYKFPIRRKNKPTLIGGVAIDITERKEAEDALRESERKFRELADSLPEAVWEIDLNGKFTYVNQMTFTISGYAAEDVEKGLGFLQMIIPEERDKAKEHMQSLLEGKDLGGLEYTGLRKDGNRFYAVVHAKPNFKEGKPASVRGITVDITERKEAEEALRKSEEKYKKLFEETTDAIFVADAETGILIDCNRVAAKLVGRAKSELVGKPQRILHPPQEIEGEFSATFKQHLREKEGQVLEAKVITKEGEIKDVAIRASRFELRGRKLIQALFRDITERKKAEEALRQSEEKYRSVIENIGMGVSLISPKMEVLALNRQLSQWYPDVDVSKKPVCYEVFNNPPRKSICPYCPTCKSLKDGRVHEAVTETPAGDKTKNYRIISSPIKDKDGRVIAAIEMVEDITDLRQRGQELALYREKMARAEQLASVGTLSATLAHELTQPLTVIRLSVENLLEELKTASCPETVTEQLTDSLSGIVDAAAIVDRFRDFARKSSEKTLGKVELKAIVGKIVELLNESAKRANLALLIRNMNELPPVHSNERDIAQLFFALIENSIQAADGKKQSRLTITGNVKNEHIRLSFSDNCGGIAPENLDRIFEPFFTTGSDGTRTGLGLCIVKKILSECGGDIQVDSRFGKGTTFYVTLPLHSKKSNEDF